MFRDRVDAGRRLAAALNDLQSAALPVVVLGIPRGGVIVAREVALMHHTLLDVVLTHKLGAPDNPELAIGAVAEDGTLLLDDELIAHVGLTPQYLDAEAARQKAELARRAALYRGGRDRATLIDRVAVVIDDGVATGLTMIAALRSIRAARAIRVIAAVPVGPAGTLAQLRREADQVVCLATPATFWSVSMFYESFAQVSDEQVITALAK
jgi:putative phosphoribosyl transferase